MNSKESFALNIFNNISLYLSGQIKREEIESFNSGEINYLNDRQIVKLTYMKSVYRYSFLLQLMNNKIYHCCLSSDCFEKVCCLTDTISFNSGKMKAIYNGIISYIFHYIDCDYESIKDLIEHDEWEKIIMNSYIFHHIEPIDLYYCSKYLNLTVKDEVLKRFFIYCDSVLIIERNDFLDKIKKTAKKIIQKYQTML